MIDSHAHLTCETLVNEAPSLVARAKEAGVETIVNICTDVASLEAGLELRKQCPNVYLTASTTPHDVEKQGESFFPIVAEHARQGAFVAIGETGLDYYYDHSPRDLQQEFLRRYFALATEVGLPVVIHCRDAFDAFFAIQDECYKGPGILHCFTGTPAEADEVIKRGWYLSLSGIVTYKKSEELREVARRVPLDRLLIETDAPYLAPQSKRGKTNESAYIVETAQMIADTRGISLDEVIKATASNAKKIFRL